MSELEMTFIESVFDAVGNSALGIFMAESEWAFPTFESVHVLALCLTFGAIAVVDLRLLGVSFRSWSLVDMTKTYLPVTWCAFAVALVTGVCLLSSNPLYYLGNPAFRLKMLFMACAGINMLLFHFVTGKDIDLIDEIKNLSTSARVAGGISLMCWLMVVGTGRWIGFISPW